MANKRTVIGVVSAGALLLGIAITRSAITTERIVTDEAFNLAQQTGQPVWETYKRNVWLAWIGSIVAVAGVSGVAASLYARDEEIDDIADRASGLRDRLATTVPALKAIATERDRRLPAAKVNPEINPDINPETNPDIHPEKTVTGTETSTLNAAIESRPAFLNEPEDLEERIDEAEANRPKKTPATTPIAPQASVNSPLDLTPTRESPSESPGSESSEASKSSESSESSELNRLDYLFEESQLEESQPEESQLEESRFEMESNPNPDSEWLHPIELRDKGSSMPELDAVTHSSEPEVEPTGDRDTEMLEALLIHEPEALIDWDTAPTLAMQNPHDVRDLHDVHELDSLGLETNHDVETVRKLETERQTPALNWLDSVGGETAADLSSDSASLLKTLVMTPLLCVCGDDRSQAIAVAKANVLRELIDQRLDQGHKCIVCDPLDEAQTWRGCDRLGQQEDYATIDVALSTIVAEIETRLEATNTGQVDFSPITLVCFHPSDWLDRCASAPLLAARTIDAARVAISILFIDTAPPSNWRTFGHHELSFPEDAFVELELDINESEALNPSDTGVSAAKPDQASSRQPSQGHASTAIAWLRDPTHPDAAPFQTIALPEFNTPLFHAPPIRSRPPITVPFTAPPNPAPHTTAQNSVHDQSPNQAENGYSMADTEKQLRSQIALFQDLGMTREQIVIAVWDVRDPNSDEYEIASAFYDRLTILGWASSPGL